MNMPSSMGDAAQMPASGAWDELCVRVQALEARVQELQQQLDKRSQADRVCLVCFSGDWDRLFAALTIANGALALGQEVHIFFTFWAVAALRSETGTRQGDSTSNGQKNSIQKMMAAMLPRGMSEARLSRMNMMGLSKIMLKKLMTKNNIDDIDNIDVLMKEAKDLDIHIHFCETSAGLFG